MSELRFKIKQRVIIAGNHTGVIMARSEGRPQNIYRVEAFFEQYSGWYPETQLEADPIQQCSPTDVADAAIDVGEMKKTIDYVTELRQENQRLKETLTQAAGLLYRLEHYNCIQTDDNVLDGQIDHWREVGRWVVRHSVKLLNTQFNDGIDQ